MAITSLGAASGIDLESIVNALVAVEREPKLNSFAAREGQLSVSLSAYSALKGSIKSFKDVVEQLTDVDNFNQRSVSIRQPGTVDVISVKASGDSTPGNFDVEVLALAQGSRAETNPGLFTDSTQVVTASGGKLSFAAGTSAFDLDIAAGATLEEIREAINSSDDNSFISANIINTGTEAKLILTSNVSGSGNDLTITNDNQELDSISTIATGATPGMTIALEDMAQDAEIRVDGTSIVSQTNTFKDAIQDLTITAKELTDAGESARLSVTHNTDAVKFNINAFVDSFNELVDIIDQMTAKDAVLNGDAVTRKFEQQLLREISSEISGAGKLSTIYDAGVSLAEGGKLETRSSGVSPLNEVLEENFGDLEKLFAGETGLATKISDFLESYVEKQGVLVQTEESIRGQIDKIGDARLKFLERMESFETTLRRQYTSLDILVGSLSAQGDYISSQLKSISSFKND